MMLRPTATKVVPTSDYQLIVTFDNGESQTLDALLVASGRRPNIDDLGLENTGIQLTSQGAIQVNEPRSQMFGRLGMSMVAHNLLISHSMIFESLIINSLGIRRVRPRIALRFQQRPS